MPLIADEIVIEFAKSSGEVFLRADLVELMLGIREVDEGKQWEHQSILAFREWIHQKTGTIVSLSQAEAIYKHVLDQYTEFKKKLDGSLKSHISSTSTLAVSTIE